MKLSDAIMLNGMTKPQGRGFQSIGSVDAPCVIGGALQTIGKQIPNDCGADNYRRFMDAWPWTMVPDICPACGEPDTADSIIWHLNDEKHNWTRKQIAAWVARIEPADIPAEVETEELCTAQK